MTETTDPGTEKETGKETTEETDALGDGGKKALEAERRARREAERRAAAAEEKATELELANARASVAAAKGLSDAQAELLQGTTTEELEAHADKLRAAFTAEADEGEPTPTRRPREALRPGASNADRAEDMGAVADRIVGGT